ncbi:hypothetical protein PINS_up013951 [Pythium insidiosum]|nr:hypothetical protein PINS_up013951 [Pythium insidiosum]
MTSVTVKVLYFASVREDVGKREETLTLTCSANAAPLKLADLRARLCELYPESREAIEHITLARNLEYASDDTPLCDGDEVALIPPISGG